jgi:hypothetical protein
MAGACSPLMNPGLHALSCSRCGAPLDPTEKAKGSVVTCEHCAQPHLWVAPGKVEAHSAATRSRAALAAGQPPSRKGPLLIALAIGAALLLVGMGGAGWLLVSMRGSGVREVPATADMPIAIGDGLHMQVDNSGCEVRVQDVLADGRLLGRSCGAVEPSPLDRSLLTLDAFPEGQSWSNPEAGDIVLAKSGSSWQRRAVVGPEPGKSVRVRPLVDGDGNEAVVAQSSILRVQRASDLNCSIQVPLASSVALEPGDIVELTEATVTHSVSVVRDLGDSVAVKLDIGSGGGELTRKKNTLSGRAVCSRTSLKPETRVLVKDGGKWLRREVITDGRTSVELRDPASGASETRAKHDMLSLANAVSLF